MLEDWVSGTVVTVEALRQESGMLPILFRFGELVTGKPSEERTSRFCRLQSRRRATGLDGQPSQAGGRGRGGVGAVRSDQFRPSRGKADVPSTAAVCSTIAP